MPKIITFHFFNLPVQSVQQFNNDQNGQSHGHWVWVFKDLAVNTFEFWSTSQALHKVGQLVPRQSWTIGSIQEPPSSREDGGKSDVASDSAVSEQEPVGDKSITRRSWWFVHDIEIWWIEGEGGGWKTVGVQVDPEKLDWDQSFWDAKGGSQEDADDLTDVGRDQVEKS